MVLEEEAEPVDPSAHRAPLPRSRSGSPSSSFVPPVTANSANCSTGNMYQRSAEVTNVNRIGRARSVLRVKVILPAFSFVTQ